MNVIETDSLTKRFGTFTAVDHISFEVGEGEIFGFLSQWRRKDDGDAYALRIEQADFRAGSGSRIRHLYSF